MNFDISFSKERDFESKKETALPDKNNSTLISIQF